MGNVGVLTKIQGSTYQQFGKEILSTQIRFSMLRAMAAWLKIQGGE